MRRFLALVALTAMESLRQPVFMLLTLTCVLLTLLNPILLIHPFGEAGKLPRDGALAFQFAIGVLVTASGAAMALGREVRAGTAASVLAKPVSRSAFFLAKYLGVALLVLVFSLCAALATLLNQVLAAEFQNHHALLLVPLTVPLCLLLAAVLNYTARLTFTSTAVFLMVVGLLAAIGIVALLLKPHFEFRVMAATGLVTLALLTLAAIAVTVSTRVPPAPTVAICAALFLAGLVSDYAFGRHAPHNIAAWLLYAAIPNWQHFWAADGLTAGGTIPGAYVAATFRYAACYVLGVLCLGMLLFEDTDVR